MGTNDNLRDREFIGQGWAFPLRLDPRGQVSLARGEDEIEQAMQIILGTIPGERRMRPEFGCRVWEMLFAPNNPATRNQIIQYVREALERWEPRIEVADVEVYGDPTLDGGVTAEITYYIRDRYDPRSIVYPFYIAQEEAV